MSIIALVGNKGGAGKTTLSVNLAAGLARKAPTIVLDADPQGSAYQWNAIAGDDSVLKVVKAEEDLAGQADRLKNQYQHIVIDCPPSVLAKETHAALRVTNLALVPVQPSPVDLWATVHIEKAITEAQNFNPSLRAVLVINQLESRTIMSQLIRDALAEIKVPVAEAAVRRRAVYRASALEARSVYAMGKRASQAVAELDQLICEVVNR
jgi:chromosome partitioning protein